ncbi:MAG TPA: DUF433 domain-containing protein [Verrucomicrobiae bacterium]|nr:DUF433 domain-containing protein [Verrucomicrobiae bacterium]
MLDWSKCPAVERIAEKVSGAWLFKDTRVPVAALFQNLEDGATVDNFLEWFPGVTREQIKSVLDHEFLTEMHKGLAQVEKGQTVTHEQVIRDLKSWLR